MPGQSARVAVGGVFSAMCLTLMFLTGLIPLSAYAMPALAGAMLTAVVIENGRKTALLVYISVSALSVFIVPEREAALLFIIFFGYYAIVKGIIERVRRPLPRRAIKFAVYNAATVGGFWLSAALFGMTELMDESGPLKYSLWILFVGGNLFFVLYDQMLTRYTAIYIYRFRPKFLRR